MLLGPIFTRELVVAPRRSRLYVLRSAYVTALLVLMCTAWLIVAGTQVVRNVGDFARFGATLFQILAPLQLVLAIALSAVLAAGSVAQEKDRGTLVLLLMTSLSNSELVLGKLAASMLSVLVLLVASLPVLIGNALFGGTSYADIGRAWAATLAGALAAGSMGLALAFWREKTFQSLALTVLALVIWLAIGEAVAYGAFGDEWRGVPAAVWASGISPLRAVLDTTRPLALDEPAIPWAGSSFAMFIGLSTLITAAVNLVVVARVRKWNPSQEARSVSTTETGGWDVAPQRTATEAQLATLPAGAARQSVHAAPGRVREPWSNPILWREMCTWAYGRRVLAIRVIYLLLVVAAVLLLRGMSASDAGLTRLGGALVVVPLALVSLTLVNAQAVTALTTERDARAFDLLLVTDLTAKEFVFGKLLGVLYNTKEMVLCPLAVCVYAWWLEALSGEDLTYLLLGLVLLNFFVAVLGIHAGMSYGNSRTAIGVSLGTVFFLFLGVATCMRMIVAFSGTFSAQFAPFAAIVLGGAVGLNFALGARNPSQAIFWTSVVLPLATFYAITSFLLDATLAVFLVTAASYGFATAAMLVPAIFEFDVATGRTSSGDE